MVRIMVEVLMEELQWLGLWLRSDGGTPVVKIMVEGLIEELQW